MKNTFFILLIVALSLCVSFAVGAFVASDFTLPFLSAVAVSQDGVDLQPTIYPDLIGTDVWRLDCNVGSAYDVRLSDFYYHVGDKNNVALMDVIPEIPVQVTFEAVCTPLYKLTNGGYIGYPDPENIKIVNVNSSFFVPSGSSFNIGDYLPVEFNYFISANKLTINDYLVSNAILHFTPASNIYTLSAGEVVNGSVSFSQSSVYQDSVQDVFVRFIPDSGYTSPADVNSPFLQVNNAKITNYVLNSDGSASALLYDITGNVTIDVTYQTIVQTFPITYSFVGLTPDSSNPNTISEADDVAIKFTAQSGYLLPSESDISVVNADVFNYSISGNTATLGIHDPRGPVYIVATGVKNYNVFYNLQHCSISPTDNSITSNTTRDYVITPADDFGLSVDSLNVSGAVVTNKKLNTNGTLSFTVSQVSSNVTISCIAELVVFNVSYSLTHVSYDAENPTFVTAGDSDSVFTFTADSGYTLPDTISVSNCTYSYDKSAGTVAISNPTGNILFTINGVASQSYVLSGVYYVPNRVTYDFEHSVEALTVIHVPCSFSALVKMPDTTAASRKPYNHFDNNIYFGFQPNGNVSICGENKYSAYGLRFTGNHTDKLYNSTNAYLAFAFSEPYTIDYSDSNQKLIYDMFQLFDHYDYKSKECVVYNDYGLISKISYSLDGGYTYTTVDNFDASFTIDLSKSYATVIIINPDGGGDGSYFIKPSINATAYWVNNSSPTYFGGQVGIGASTNDVPCMLLVHDILYYESGGTSLVSANNGGNFCIEGSD